MRTLPVLVAALALPVSALAQTAADNDQSTEVSALVVQARKATAVSSLMVKGGCPPPARDSDWPSRWFDAPSDSGKRTQESAGTRAFLLRLITGFRTGDPDYAHMGKYLAQSARDQLLLAKQWIVCRGVFEDIKFLHVSQEGYDDFEVDFSNGAIEWEVQPLDSHQVAQHSAARMFYPQPATRRFEDLLKSIERGRPNYADLAPGFASTLQAQLPALQPTLKDWGGPRSISFLRQGDDGSYVYRVGYKNRRVVWELAPLDDSGKVTGLKYAEAPD